MLFGIVKPYSVELINDSFVALNELELILATYMHACISDIDAIVFIA